MGSVPGQFQELPKKRIPRDEMGLPLGLAHARRGEGDDDGIIAEEGHDGDATQLHVELLFLLKVDLALGLVDLEEVLDDGLVDVVTDGVLDLLHVEIKLVGSAGRRVGVVVEELADQFL